MPFLRTNLETLLFQISDEHQIEIIVSDNFSTDGTSEYLQSLKCNHVRVVKPRQPLSLAQNWNFVSNFATGDYIKLLCADDLIYPEGLNEQIKILKSNPAVSATVGTRSLINSEGKVLVDRIRLFKKIGMFSMKSLTKKFWITGTNYFGEPGALLFRAETFRQGLPFDDALPYVIDVDFYLRSLANATVNLSNTPTLFFRIHKLSLSFKLQKSQSKQFYALYRKVILRNQKFNLKMEFMGAHVLLTSRIKQSLRLLANFYFAK
jgi:glycosyltransferase involved in cell wall biosynthesis